tara:strand:- start:5399 stop:6709 length:1311 start_codon:yes stop_codon:yes gene_type:complete
MGYKAYPDYKESGVEWVSAIPKHWEIRRLKFMATIQNGRDYKEVESDDGFPVIGSGGQFTWASEFLYNGESVLFGRKGTIDKPLHISGKFWTVDTMFYSVIHPDVFGRYLYYFSTIFQYEKLATQTALPSITQHDLGNYFLCYPYTNEQKLIANFLDHKTAQIDSLIEKKRELIEKLQEQRIAAITHAVTKGLGKLAPMRESGIDWLGDIPAHWDIRKLRFVLSKNFTNGLFKKAEFWGQGNKIINVFDVYIHNDVVNEDDLDSVECSEEEAAQYSAIHGDFFLVRSSLKLAGIGKSATVINPLDNLVFECHLVRGRPDLNLVDVRFLNLFLNSKYAREYFISRANSVTMATIDQTKFKDLLITLPCKADQIQIVRIIDAQLSRLDAMVDKNKNTVTRLQEYRTALITAAVTGQIDVRDWQAPEPIQEPEADKDVA